MLWAKQLPWMVALVLEALVEEEALEALVKEEAPEALMVALVLAQVVLEEGPNLVVEAVLVTDAAIHWAL